MYTIRIIQVLNSLNGIPQAYKTTIGIPRYFMLEILVVNSQLRVHVITNMCIFACNNYDMCSTAVNSCARHVHWYRVIICNV